MRTLKAELLLILALVFCSYNLMAAQNKTKTVITGESMEMLEAGKVVIFSGSAKVVHGKDILKADEIVQDKQANTVNAKGNVSFETLVNTDEELKGLSAKAKYDLNTKHGELWENRPKLFYSIKSSTRPVTVTADRIEFDQTANKASASGNVEIISSSASAYSQRALFVYQDKKIVLNSDKEQPKLYYYAQGRNDRFSADQVTMFFDKKRIILEGNVKGFVKEIKKSK